MSGLLWPELEPEAVDAGFFPEIPPQMAASDVLEALARRHPMDGWNGRPGRWVFLTEVAAETGLWGEQQRFDAVALGLVPSNGYARVVYEVKISRGDWLRELRPRVDRRVSSRWDHETSEWRTEVVRTERPGNKWDAALGVSTEFWIAAPPRVVQVSELPPEAGLVEIRPWGPTRELRARVIRPAPVRETPHPGREFWASVLRYAAALRPGPSRNPEADDHR